VERSSSLLSALAASQNPRLCKNNSSNIAEQTTNYSSLRSSSKRSVNGSGVFPRTRFVLQKLITNFRTYFPMKASSWTATSTKNHCLRDVEMKVQITQDSAVLPMDQDPTTQWKTDHQDSSTNEAEKLVSLSTRHFP